MPIYQEQSPLGSAVDFIGSYFAGKRQRQLEDIQQRQQQQQFAAQMAALNERTAAERSRVDVERQNLALGEKRFGLEQQEAGVNPQTSQPYRYDTNTGPKSTPRQKAAALMAAATAAANNGDKTHATLFAAQAKQYADEADKFDKDALAYKQFAEKQLQDKAQREHWGKQDAARYAEVQARIDKDAADIAQGAQRIDIAKQHLGIALQQLGMSRGRYQMEQGRYQMEKGRYKMQGARFNVSSGKTTAEGKQRVDAFFNRTNLPILQAQLHQQGITEPTDDPKFQAGLKYFVEHPEDRVYMLSDPTVPASTKAYLQALQKAGLQ